MKKIVFIIPYFGEFPNYFHLFLNSCKNNPKYTWFILTDNIKKYEYPENVKVKYLTFEELRKKIQMKFKFKISLETPYKLCDYKPAYGYIFEDEIEEYDWWGHCDIDLIFGDLTNFINDTLLENYKKLFILGHLTLYENTKINNRVFMSKVNGKKYFEDVFRNSENYIFDELYNKSINNIYNFLKIPYYKNILCADIYTKSSKFKIVENYEEQSKKYKIKNHKKNFFVYDYGKIKEIYLEDSQWIIKEYMYIHLQKRKMKVKKIDNINYFKIIPNEFSNLEISNLFSNNLKNIDKIKKYKINCHYFLLRSKNLIKKIKNKLRKIGVIV